MEFPKDLLLVYAIHLLQSVDAEEETFNCHAGTATIEVQFPIVQPDFF